jgi:type II secretory ATPase GspE/PulE/Tfp pilus assembly ATPase PilB-like protein
MPSTEELEIERKRKLAKIQEEEEEDLAKYKASKLGVPYVNLKLHPIENRALAIIPEEKARNLRAIVFERKGDIFYLAVENPESPKIKELIEDLSKFGEVKLHLASRSSLDWALEKYIYLHKPLKPILGKIEIPDEVFGRFHQLKILDEICRVINKLHEEEISVIVEHILAAAVSLKSSDIHIENQEFYCLLRFRIDGVLHDIDKIPTKEGKLLIDRFKLLGRMKLNIQNKSQDGRFTIVTSNEEIQVRTSTVPGAYGENIVMRLLYPETIALELEDLGIQPKDLPLFYEQIAKPNGMILNTGPTGSGKTTTLYAFLKRKRNPEIKIITIEDPIEYHLEGISQTQVSPEKGYDFLTGLRSALRQDPDVILVGEIRDAETAKTAINAAYTGHLVFSTLHTNEAAGTIARLEELGVDRKTIISSVNLIIAQRLVRRLCNKCKQPYAPDPKTKENILKALAIISPKAGLDIPEDITTLWKPVGCQDCWGTGYKGQIGIFEFFAMTKPISNVIMSGASIADIRETAINEGMITLLQEGYLKAINGITSIEEVIRVAGETAEYVEYLYEKAMAQKLRRGIRYSPKDMDTISNIILKPENISNFLKKFEEKSQKDLLKYALATAVNSRATDLHIEPQEKNAILRFRIDGVLYDIHKVALEIYPLLISEIKLLTGLKIEEHEKIQEGRFSLMFPQETRDVRVSIIPGGYGETAVLRILMPEEKTIKFEDLGITEELFNVIKSSLEIPTGIILVSGPTSAGKTTTLYAITQYLNSPELKIITIEDPIEYRIKGIIQTQVDVEKGYTFASALRAILRQNPNIILLGEIRDNETATLAIQASLTGHLVLSTVHANDAVTVIARLKTLGVTTGDMATALHTIIAQRLVRRICQNCKTLRNPTEEERKMIIDTINNIPLKWRDKFKYLIEGEIKIPKALGCEDCNFIGYKGQIGIFEILIPDEKFREEIQKLELTPEELHRAAYEAGMINLRQDGIIKVLRGITTLEEIDRVL